MVEIYYVIIEIVIIGIGVFFGHRSYILWKRNNLISIVAIVAKEQSFLSDIYNLSVITFLSGVLHVAINVVQEYGFLSASGKDLVHILYNLNITAMLLLLTIIVVKWYKILATVDRWDRHWIGKQ